MKDISTVVITLNEEANLARCLDSARSISCEILVIDSGSTDRTREIAARYTDRVLVHEWQGYGAQKQFALNQARCAWVLSIDADEELSPELRDEIARLDDGWDGYLLPRRVWYMGRWILHGVWHPDPVLRLFRADRARITTDRVHESVQLAGRARHLRGTLRHFPYRDLAHHMAKMNSMTTLAAEEMFDRGRRASWTRLALQPPWAFVRSYLLRGGWLDGVPGLIVAVLHAQYVFMKYAKLRERATVGAPR